MIVKKINIHWLATPVIILASAFVTNAIIMLLCHYNPLEAYQAAVSGAFGNSRKFGRDIGEEYPVSDGRDSRLRWRFGVGYGILVLKDNF